MSQISQKSISGITSITTPAGIDNQFTLHTNDTSQAAKLDAAGNFHFSNHVNTTGISSASNFKTGSSDLHSTGLSVASIDVGNNIKLGNAGVITATSFVGDGSDLTNLPAGLGTALSSTQTDPLNKLYYTNQVLGVGATITVDPPASASKAYTQYADIKVDSDADLIIAEGDDLIPDVLGLADFGNFGGGASAGRIRVNSITNAAANGATTIQNGVVISGMTTITGGLSIGGTITYEDVTNIDSIGIITARNSIDCNGDLDVDGHTNLDNVSISGVTTITNSGGLADFKAIELEKSGTSGASRINFLENGTVRGGLTYSHDNNRIELMSENGESIRFQDKANNQFGLINSSGLTVNGTSGITALASDINGDLDVDGHTNLDNVSIVGIVTISAGTNNEGLRITGQNNNAVIFTSPSINGSAGYRLNHHPATNVLRVDTTDQNGTYTGIVASFSSAGLDMADNIKLRLGTSQDLTLYHFGNNAYIDNATGNILIRQGGSERLSINQHGTITNTTSSSHSQGAGTFNIKGVINQYSQGSGSGLIFDCDFGRLTGYGDDTNVTNGTNLSACLAHSTTDWTSSSSNTPMSVNGGQLQYRVGFGGYMEGISNGGRVSVGAGSGVPAMSDKLNTASMTIETWCWYDGTDREVVVSRYGSGFPNNFNMICDPNGQFHYNSSGSGAGSGNISGEHFPDKTWHHHVWQYDSPAGGVHRWYINGAFANSRNQGSTVAVNSGTGFGIFSRADRYEDFRGKIAVVRIYNRALSATEIKNHFELERGRFGV